jgi:hypothetical protein
LGERQIGVRVLCGDELAQHEQWPNYTGALPELRFGDAFERAAVLTPIEDSRNKGCADKRRYLVASCES